MVYVIQVMRTACEQDQDVTKTLHVSDSSSVHHQEFFTVHTAMVYVIQVLRTACEQDQDRTSWSWSQAVSKPVWHTPLLCVQWQTPDDGQRNCPKHVEFHSKNKFEKLVHLVGFIIRIYDDARSPEHQKVCILYWNIYILHIQYIHTLQVCKSISGIVIYSNGGGCQYTILNWNFVFDLHDFQKCNPGIKWDLAVQYAYCTWHRMRWYVESDDALLLSYTHNCFGLFRPM